MVNYMESRYSIQFFSRTTQSILIKPLSMIEESLQFNSMV